MGAYVNHPMGKEIWLITNGEEVSLARLLEFEENWEEESQHHFPVILVDNGPFTAAGIAYSKDELNAFTDPRDIRPKRFFIAPIHRLHEVSPELDEYMERHMRMERNKS